MVVNPVWLYVFVICLLSNWLALTVDLIWALRKVKTPNYPIVSPQLMKKTESSYLFIWVRSITIVAETAQQKYVGIFFITNLQGHMKRRNMGPKEVSRHDETTCLPHDETRESLNKISSLGQWVLNTSFLCKWRLFDY